MSFLSKYGVARVIEIPIIKRAVVDFAVGADWTPAAGDVKITKDGGAAANVTNLPTALAMGNGALWSFSLTATEMQAARVVVTVADSATKAVEDQSFIVETYGHASAQHEIDLDQAQLPANITQLLGTAWLTPAVAGTPDVNAKQLGGTAQTGRDVGASVLLSSGSGAGQLDFTAGVVKANLAQILGTALTETAGLLAGGFKKFFNVATPTGTVNSLADAVPGAAGGGLIAGSNAATTVNITGNLTGNVTGSVGSVTGAVGSVTGAVGSVTAGVTLAASAVQAIWDALTSALTAAGSIGKKLADWAVGTIDTYTGNTKQTGDNYARLGAPSGASVSADIAAAKVDTAAIKAKTDNLPASPAAVGSAMTLAADSVTAATLAPDAGTELGTAVWASATRTLTAFGFPQGVVKNQALNSFEFPMIDSADHVTGKTGVTVTAQRSIDGGAFAACANSASEVGNGIYKINLAASDLNGDVITFKFTGTGCDATLITIKTQA